VDAELAFELRSRSEYERHGFIIRDKVRAAKITRQSTAGTKQVQVQQESGR